MKKTIHLGLIGGQFDHQYTFDLQGYLTVHDFHSTLCLFNEAAKRHPPPGHKGLWCTTLFAFWALITAITYTIWMYIFKKTNAFILLMVPSTMLLTTLLWVWRYRRMQRRFQSRLIELCTRINATENIRGINYRLMKRGVDMVTQADQARAVWHASYALLIELDDRYLALGSSPSQRLDMTTIPIPYRPPSPLPPVAYSLKHDDDDPYNNDSSFFYDKEKQ
ncbi:hypothetical protein O0I10_008226 [Lichtheimia ornata]|uniref:Uncharacterized protein n=1 Tax=Lichtheimia ornata TaxID=688661 RepID=A0AAD7UZD9_9FUNG|nr:uncharacterized protein O0I10_008226 [Lichtheimia ornata]KAJ8656005.1 hypothetical protein O0I10_008226 [Lichtheimia ornata]